MYDSVSKREASIVTQLRTGTTPLNVQKPAPTKNGCKTRITLGTFALPIAALTRLTAAGATARALPLLSAWKIRTPRISMGRTPLIWQTMRRSLTAVL
jgi:hypothetical protein